MESRLRSEITGSTAKHKLSIAPMLDWTDRHCRYFYRVMSKRTVLYTEMVTTGAIIFGKGDYLSFNSEKVQVNSPTSLRLPKWLTDENWNLTFKRSKVIEHLEDQDLVELEVNRQKVNASTIELAVLEMLEDIQNESSFVFASELFQGLTSLRPRRVQSLLERSKSIKVKRLFLFLSNYYQHPWLSRLDENKIELGSGKRQIVTGGALDKSYQITVPKNFQTMGAVSE